MTLTSTTARFTAGIRVLLAGICLLTPAMTFAQDPSTYRATVYGFVPSLSGETAFPTPLGSTIDVSGETLMESAELVLMGAFEFQKGRWGAFADVMYLDLANSKTGTRDIAIAGLPLPLPITANADIGIEATIVTAAANFRAVSGRRATIDLFGGTRRISATGTLDYTFSSPVGPFAGAGLQGSSEATNGNWDGIGGVRGRIQLGRVVIPYHADAGAGESDLTWQVMGGIAYAFDRVEVGAVWRHLAYQMDSDRKIAELNFSGPAVGVAFKW